MTRRNQFAPIAGTVERSIPALYWHRRIEWQVAHTKLLHIFLQDTNAAPGQQARGPAHAHQALFSTSTVANHTDLSTQSSKLQVRII